MKTIKIATSRLYQSAVNCELRFLDEIHKRSVQLVYYFSFRITSPSKTPVWINHALPV